MTSSGVAQLRQYKPSRLTIVFRTRERCEPSLVLAASDRFASDGERLDPRERDIARRFRLAARDYPFPARLGRRLPEGAGLVEPYRHRAVAALRRLDRGAAPAPAAHAAPSAPATVISSGGASIRPAANTRALPSTPSHIARPRSPR
ncbi:hypothetical protein [Sorangium sp. So ce117]|uniref:hypothetical protein n=1 Tax=Sorangium sp. So ce117 TaxID=3133277 RepID=UPI003F6293E3